ncbi:MAG: hypothetical protein NTW66_00510 [Candidatus Magasanikbacteria bacterium]|nr:hypothetical protein [Candidatus Magasanikbacteria bacterium]
MEKPLAILERRYQSIKEFNGDRPILVGIADYVSYVGSQPRIREIIDEIIKPKELLVRQLEEIEKRAVKELDDVKNRILKKILSAGITNEPAIESRLVEYDKWKKGDIYGTQSLCEGLEEQLQDIIRYLWESSSQSLVAEYAEPYKRDPKYIDKYIFSNTMIEWRAKKNEVCDERVTALWGNWGDLHKVCSFISDGGSRFEDVFDHNLYESLNFGVYRSDEFDLDGKTHLSAREIFKPSVLNKERLLMSLSRIHLYFVEQLDIVRPLGKENTISSIGLPPGTELKDMTVKIINSFDFEVWLRNTLFGKYTFKHLGCVKKNTKDEKPDEQWSFLKDLSLANGVYDYRNIQRTPSKIERLRQKKKKLSSRLMKFFGLEEMSIIEEDMAYKTVFKLEPEPILRGDGEIYGLRGGGRELLRPV